MNKIITISAIAMFSIFNSINANAGNVNGPKLMTDSVKAYESYSYNVIYSGGKSAKIEVKGYGTTNINCSLVNSDNEEVAIYNSNKGYCEFKWLPEKKSLYRIVIKNLGDKTNYFVIETN